MFQLEIEVRRWCRTNFRTARLSKNQLLEMEDHLYCEIDRWVAEGKTEKDAFDCAIARFGDVDTISAEFHKNRTKPSMNWRGLFELLRLPFRIGLASPSPFRIAVLGALLVVSISSITGSTALERIRWLASELLAILTMPFVS